MTEAPDRPADRIDPAEMRTTVRHSDFADVRLPPIPSVPGMVTESECRYLYWLTSRGYSGAGAVVEVGTWLGRSTLHLAAGLRDAGYNSSLHCFDQFVWRSDHARKSALPLQRGGDFQPYFERNVRPVYPGIEVTRATLDEMIWGRGPIEILFLDAPKTLVDLSSALASFASSLAPGKSLIVFQDFLHSPSYALAAVVSRLRESLRPVHFVTGGATATFAVTAALPFDSAQPIDWNFGRWSADDVVESWTHLTLGVPAEARARLWLGCVLLLHRRRETGGARSLLRRLSDDAAMRPHLQRYGAALLYRDYPSLFRASGLEPPAGGGLRSTGARQAIRRLRARARRLFLSGDLTRAIG